MNETKSKAVTGGGNAPRAAAWRIRLENGLDLTTSMKLEAELERVKQERDELLNEISNLKHDYAIVSSQRNEALQVIKFLLSAIENREGEKQALYEANEFIAKSEGRAE